MVRSDGPLMYPNANAVKDRVLALTAAASPAARGRARPLAVDRARPPDRRHARRARGRAGPRGHRAAAGGRPRAGARGAHRAAASRSGCGSSRRSTTPCAISRRRVAPRVPAERGEPDRELQPVGEQPVGEGGEHRRARRDPDQRERAREPGLHEPEAARRDRDLRQHLGGAEREQHEPGARLRADGGERGQQRRVVERPAAAGRRQRALPARAEGPDDPRALAQQALGSPREGSEWRRSRLRTRWTTRPTQASGGRRRSSPSRSRTARPARRGR